LIEGAQYTATIVSGPLFDQCASATHNDQNFVALGSSASFHAWAFIPCLVKFETYDVTGGTVGDITVLRSIGSPAGDGKWQDGILHLICQQPTGISDDRHEQYGGPNDWLVYSARGRQLPVRDRVG